MTKTIQLSDLEGFLSKASQLLDTIKSYNERFWRRQKEKEFNTKLGRVHQALLDVNQEIKDLGLEEVRAGSVKLRGGYRVCDALEDALLFVFRLMPAGEPRVLLNRPISDVDKFALSLAGLKQTNHVNIANQGRSRKKQINFRMIVTLQQNRDANGWSARAWARHLKCAHSSVIETTTWKELEMQRESLKAEKAMAKARNRMRYSERNVTRE